MEEDLIERIEKLAKYTFIYCSENGEESHPVVMTFHDFVSAIHPCSGSSSCHVVCGTVWVANGVAVGGCAGPWVCLGVFARQLMQGADLDGTARFVHQRPAWSTMCGETSG